MASAVISVPFFDITLAEAFEIDLLAVALDQNDRAQSEAGGDFAIDEIVDRESFSRDSTAPGGGPSSTAAAQRERELRMLTAACRYRGQEPCKIFGRWSEAKLPARKHLIAWPTNWTDRRYCINGAIGSRPRPQEAEASVSARNHPMNPGVAVALSCRAAARNYPTLSAVARAKST